MSTKDFVLVALYALVVAAAFVAYFAGYQSGYQRGTVEAPYPPPMALYDGAD